MASELINGEKLQQLIQDYFRGVHLSAADERYIIKSITCNVEVLVYSLLRREAQTYARQTA